MTIVDDRHRGGCFFVVLEGEGGECHLDGFAGLKSDWRLPFTHARGKDLGPVVRSCIEVAVS